MDYLELTREFAKDKLVSAQSAIGHIKPGSRVFVGTGCGEPQHLIKTMVAEARLMDIMVYQMLSHTFAEFMDDPGFRRRFFLKLFFISQAMRQAAFEGKIDYVPAYLSQIPNLFHSGRIGLDVALVQVSPPDEFGYLSLGVSVDITLAGLENSPLVIAQVNPMMPRTWGDSLLHVDDVDYLVYQEEPLVESRFPVKDSVVARRIGHYVSELVEDGATLQIGFGQLPNAILPYLADKKDLGLHTQLITDAFLPLLKAKVITNKKKNHIPGRAVASLCMGTTELYDYVNNNPAFYFRSSEYVNDPLVIARNDNLISISSALEVDLTGQVSSDSLGYLFYSGIGDQVDFLRGSGMSQGGFSIIALPSTAQQGKVSRIVSHLSEGSGVATTRGDVNFIVTEYGIADLNGKSIYQRVMELAQIAHPKFREELISLAKTRHYIFADQLPPMHEDLIFVEEYKSTLKLKNGKMIEFRPLFPSDEFEYRNFFYSLKAETIYYRFFYPRKIFSHETIQEQVAGLDYKRNMSLLGLVQKQDHKEIMAIGTYAELDETAAEIAFVVREDYQGHGIGSYLLRVLEIIAKQNGYQSFKATVLKQNLAMLSVFSKRYPHRKVSMGGSMEVEIEMNFDDAIEHSSPLSEEEKISKAKAQKAAEDA